MFTPAHKDENFAELVCSNSLKSDRIDSAGGLLKAEMRLLGSELLNVAQNCRVAAGGALAVDRKLFAQQVTQLIKNNDNITVFGCEVENIDETEKDTITIVATGPLTSSALASDIIRLTGHGTLYFHDAAAPIIEADSIDMGEVFAQSRYGKGAPDYLNCPFDKAQYEEFHKELVAAQSVELHDFEKKGSDENIADLSAENTEMSSTEKITVYEGCMPIEVMAKRGADTMRFGPLRPVGLVNPKTGHRPWANIQLRAENEERTMYNIVGFQTNLKFSEQKRVFSMISGLKNANFVRYGVMHRNTFINSPKVLSKNLCLKNNPNIYFAGQITGFEGYMESAASGLLAARAVCAAINGEEVTHYSNLSMCGALLNYITSDNEDFQPMGANMGLLPPVEQVIKGKRERYRAIAKRALDNLVECTNIQDGKKMVEQFFNEEKTENQNGEKR